MQGHQGHLQPTRPAAVQRHHERQRWEESRQRVTPKARHQRQNSQSEDAPAHRHRVPILVSHDSRFEAAEAANATKDGFRCEGLNFHASEFRTV